MNGREFAKDTPDFARLDVLEVDKETAQDMIVANHYSHNWHTTFGRVNFGIYQDGKLLGVAVYGHPMNPGSWPGVTDTPPKQCIELNRLWVDDVLGANTETWFIAQTFRLLKQLGFRLVQSFADGRLGVGTIYQAANFTYHGFHSTVFHRELSTGVVHHSTPFSNTGNPRGMLTRNLMFPSGNAETFKVNTYRYLYPLDRRARKEIKLPALPYPKERCGEIIMADYRPPVTQIARAAVIADVLGHPGHGELVEYLGTLTDDPDRHLAEQRENKWIQDMDHSERLF